jgi:hypothetical protein
MVLFRLLAPSPISPVDAVGAHGPQGPGGFSHFPSPQLRLTRTTALPGEGQ